MKYFELCTTYIKLDISNTKQRKLFYMIHSKRGNYRTDLSYGIMNEDSCTYKLAQRRKVEIKFI